MSHHKETQPLPVNDGHATILVVEDDDVCRGVLVDLLCAKKYRVLEAADGRAALYMLEQSPAEISLIISDVNMPCLSGIELLSRIRRQVLKIPVILITAQASIESAVECMKIGALGYLQKPFESARLFKLVEEGLWRSRRLDSHWQAMFAEDEGPAGYTIGKLIGEGSYGLVFLVYKENQPYAIKVIKAIGIDGKQRHLASKRFLHEIKALAALRHSNIISFHEYGLAGSRQIPYLVMEYFPGDPWEDLLAQPLRVRLEMLLQAARGLEAIHKAGFCHRDIKPNNLLINSAAKTLKWSDFGLIRLPESSITMSGENIGTPAYMAPESFDSHQIDSRADIFSLGVLAYELCTRQDAFTGETIHQMAAAITYKHPVEPRLINPEISVALQKSIGRMLNKNPGARPQTMDEVIGQWQGCLDDMDKKSASPIKLSNTVVARIMRFIKKIIRPTDPIWSQDTSTPDMQRLAGIPDDELAKGSSRFKSRSQSHHKREKSPTEK